MGGLTNDSEWDGGGGGGLTSLLSVTLHNFQKSEGGRGEGVGPKIQLTVVWPQNQLVDQTKLLFILGLENL